MISSINQGRFFNRFPYNRCRVWVFLLVLPLAGLMVGCAQYPDYVGRPTIINLPNRPQDQSHPTGTQMHQAAAQEGAAGAGQPNPYAGAGPGGEAAQGDIQPDPSGAAMNSEFVIYDAEHPLADRFGIVYLEPSAERHNGEYTVYEPGHPYADKWGIVHLQVRSPEQSQLGSSLQQRQQEKTQQRIRQNIRIQKNPYYRRPASYGQGDGNLNPAVPNSSQTMNPTTSGPTNPPQANYPPGQPSYSSMNQPNYQTGPRPAGHTPGQTALQPPIVSQVRVTEVRESNPPSQGTLPPGQGREPANHFPLSGSPAVRQPEQINNGMGAGPPGYPIQQTKDVPDPSYQPPPGLPNVNHPTPNQMRSAPGQPPAAPDGIEQTYTIQPAMKQYQSSLPGQLNAATQEESDSLSGTGQSPVVTPVAPQKEVTGNLITPSPNTTGETLAPPTRTRTIDQMMTDLERHITLNPDNLQAQMALRLLYMAYDKDEKALGYLPKMSLEKQEEMLTLARAIQMALRANEADERSQTEIANQALALFKDLTEKLSQKADLSISNLNICKEVAGFGQYKAVDHKELETGLPRRIFIYCELENFVTKVSEQGLHTTELHADITLFDEAFRPVARINQDVPDTPTAKRRQDFYLRGWLDLPQLSKGKYRIVVSMEDKIAGKIAPPQKYEFEVKGL